MNTAERFLGAGLVGGVLVKFTRHGDKVVVYAGGRIIGNSATEAGALRMAQRRLLGAVVGC